MSERITIHTIESKEFTLKPRGYDRDEVDAFLDEICDEIERMNAEADSLRDQLRASQANASRPVPQETKMVYAKPTPAPAETPKPVPPASAQATTTADLVNVLELATKLKDQTIAEAKEKAEQILADAETKAKERLGELEKEQESLTNRVDALRKTVADYRERFESLLQAQQEAMDKISDL